MQDRIDAQFEMAKIEAISASMESAGQEMAQRVPAALADANDAEKYKADMGRNSMKRDHPASFGNF